MYLFLLAFGAVLSLAGVVLAGSGLSVHDRTFDTSLITPGFVAVVGGLLLIGLGCALRVLQRIEHALETHAAVPLSENTDATIESAAAARSESPGEASRLPFPVRITRPPQSNATAEPAPAADTRVEEPPLKFPKVVRGGPAPMPEESGTSPRSPLPVARGDDDTATEEAAPSFSRPFKARNGAAPSSRIASRPDLGARAALTAQRPAGPAFDALWPKGLRRSAARARPAPELPATARQPLVQAPGLRERMAQEAVAEKPVDESAPREPTVGERVAPLPAVVPNVEPEQNSEPVTVLKSGIVDGMAYTLYSDGSIEAQLPQGLLRFGSISELRAHIEQDTQNS